MFVGALAPDENGNSPAPGRAISRLLRHRLLCHLPGEAQHGAGHTLPGTDATDLQDMFKGLKALKLEVHLIMMVGGANPLNPKDEDSRGNAELRARSGQKVQGSPCILDLFRRMAGREETERKAFDAEVKQLIKVHARCFKECGLAKSTSNLAPRISAWGGVPKLHQRGQAAKVVKGINKKIKKKFFKVMIVRSLRRLRPVNCRK